MNNNISPIQIRKANAADAAAIAYVQVRTWKSTYKGLMSDIFLDSMIESPERTRRWEKSIEEVGSAFTLVAVDAKSNVIGFAHGGDSRGESDPCSKELYALYVLNSFQHKGAGQKLVLAYLAGLRKQNTDSVSVWVLKKNSAIAFYEKMGAKMLGEKIINIGGSNLEEVGFYWTL